MRRPWRHRIQRLSSFAVGGEEAFRTQQVRQREQAETRSCFLQEIATVRERLVATAVVGLTDRGSSSIHGEDIFLHESSVIRGAAACTSGILPTFAAAALR